MIHAVSMKKSMAEAMTVARSFKSLPVPSYSPDELRTANMRNLHDSKSPQSPCFTITAEFSRAHWLIFIVILPLPNSNTFSI